MCAFEAVTPAACSRLTLRLYPKQYKADLYAGLLWKVGSEKWQFEVAGEEPGAESVAGRRDAHAGDPCVLFLLDVSRCLLVAPTNTLVGFFSCFTNCFCRLHSCTTHGPGLDRMQSSNLPLR